MTTLVEAWHLARHALAAHRMRSALTALGIVIGVAAVVLTVSLFEALGHSVTQQFQGMGSQSLTISARNEYQDIVRGRINRLKLPDVELLRARCDALSELSPTFVAASTDVRFLSKRSAANVTAVTASYQEVHGRYAQMGRFLNREDDVQARRVAVIGVKLAQDLGLPANPLGQYVQVGDNWFRIVGMMEKRGELFGVSQDEFLLIPYRTGLAIMGRDREVDLMMFAQLKPGASVDLAKSQITLALRGAHKLGTNAEDDFRVEASDQMAKTLQGTMRNISLVLAAVVGISLLVGGIGIMNIMLVSVTERTREIGICKALGARHADILAQFLIESMLLASLGGVTGVVLGWGGAKLAALLFPNLGSVGMPWWSAALAWAFSLATGIVFGIAPASKAARLEPLEALRYE
jgi:putative ABC transport system permease protein